MIFFFNVSAVSEKKTDVHILMAVKHDLIELRLKVPDNNISVMLGLFQERGREKRMGWTKRPRPQPKFASSEAYLILPTIKISQGHLSEATS